MGTKVSELTSFRAEKNQVFARDPHSPLTAEQRRAFHGLNYFDENPQLVIHASVDSDVEPGEVRMSTTGGEEQVYHRYGLVRFRVDDQPAQLVLYSSDDPAYSCPLPPPENWLKVPIRAGEKVFAAGH
jgi:uncharacterized protein (DUF1684 family)